MFKALALELVAKSPLEEERTDLVLRVFFPSTVY